MSAFSKQKELAKELAVAVEKPDTGLNVKEVGFMLRLIDEGVHQGRFLELALQVKFKLQEKMEMLMNHKEVI